MNIEATLILSQWFSPGYPLGSFAYSHGLETVIQSGDVADAKQAELWLADVLRFGSGHTDAVLCRAAYGCGTDAQVAEVDAIARAYAPSAERLHEADLQGLAFARTTDAIWPVDVPTLTHPVAVGFAARALDLPLELTVSMYLQAFAANLVSCAVRLVPLGQTEGQGVLRRLTDVCAEVAGASAGVPLDDLASFAFASDIAAMRHETLEHRIFRT